MWGKSITTTKQSSPGLGQLHCMMGVTQWNVGRAAQKDTATVICNLNSHFEILWISVCTPVWFTSLFEKCSQSSANHGADGESNLVTLKATGQVYNPHILHKHFFHILLLVSWKCLHVESNVISHLFESALNPSLNAGRVHVVACLASIHLQLPLVSVSRYFSILNFTLHINGSGENRPAGQRAPSKTAAQKRKFKHACCAGLSTLHGWDRQPSVLAICCCLTWGVKLLTTH